MKLKNLKHNRDEGNALALVLIMVVFLSLWLGSVAILTQSSIKTTQTNIEQSTLRSTLVSGALGSALNQLTYDETAKARRWGMYTGNPPADGNYISSCTGRSPLIPYIDSQSGIQVDIQCTESIYSGKTSSLASYVLTGSGQACGTSCITGQDGGLFISNNSTKNCSDFPFRVSGGIVNVSGAWRNTDCTNIQLTLPTSSTGTRPTITQPNKSSGTCPAGQLKFVDSITTTSGQASSNCECPFIGVYSPSNSNTSSSNIECAYSDFSQLNLATSNDLSAYIDSVAANLSTVSGFASISGSCTAPNTTAYAGVYSNGVVLVNPGILNSTIIDSLSAITSNSKCANSSIPIIFTPGVYRFIPDSGTVTWTIDSENLIIGGVPKSGVVGARDCDVNSANPLNGVELQFTGSSLIKVTSGTLALCPRTTATGEQPVIAAPLKFINTGPWVSTGQAFITTGSGNASRCAMCILAHGLVYVPGGWVNLSLNGQSYFKFDRGGIFSAMTLTGTGSASSGGGVLPPPPFNGDRVVQLRFWRHDVRAGAQQDLGIVQVVIKDYFGRRLASGYKIISWRAAW